jgi:hypothetical protein
MRYYFFGVVILVVSIILLSLYFKRNAAWLAKKYKSGNSITFGMQGNGKDVIYQKMINVIDKPCYAVMPYGPLTTVLPIKKLALGDNTFDKFIENKITKVKDEYIEGYHYWMSDAGLYFPSHLDVLLSKLYPSLPIAAALMRQVRDAHMHFNAQRGSRIWVKLREQCDIYVKACGCFKIPLLGLFVKARYYELEESADRSLKPLKIPKRMLALMDKQEVRMMKEQYDATNGLIREVWLFISFADLHFDTRYFRWIFKEKPLEDIKEIEEELPKEFI